MPPTQTWFVGQAGLQAPAVMQVPLSQALPAGQSATVAHGTDRGDRPHAAIVITPRITALIPCIKGPFLQRFRTISRPSTLSQFGPCGNVRAGPYH
jgi:hypothetical protein